MSSVNLERLLRQNLMGYDLVDGKVNLRKSRIKLRSVNNVSGYGYTIILQRNPNVHINIRLVLSNMIQDIGGMPYMCNPEVSAWVSRRELVGNVMTPNAFRFIDLEESIRCSFVSNVNDMVLVNTVLGMVNNIINTYRI